MPRSIITSVPTIAWTNTFPGTLWPFDAIRRRELTIQSYLPNDVTWTAEGHPALNWTANFVGKDNTTVFWSLRESFADPVLGVVCKKAPTPVS
jgi:hypothetical protein